MLMLVINVLYAHSSYIAVGLLTYRSVWESTFSSFQ